MNHSKREAYLVLMAAAAVALLVADRYIMTPLIEQSRALTAEQTRLEGELEMAAIQFERRRLADRRWGELGAGDLPAEPAHAESRLLHAIRETAGHEGLVLSSLKPDRRRGEGPLRILAVQASGTGSMRSVARFLWHMETTPMPVRIEGLTLGARTGGTDDLTLQFTASTLYRPAAGEGDVPAPALASATKGVAR